MELILVVVGAIVVAAIAHHRGLEPALLIVLVGIGVSFLPGLEAPELDSHILLTVVLPPLLYSAALDFSFPTFMRNIRPILGLGVGLVVVTAFVVALVSSWVVAVPLSFGMALVLGAIVAPPDAVTAVAVGRKLGLPRRVMAILTGESLINDAAALTLFSIAVAQVAGSRNFIDNPVLLFGYSAVVGPVVGVALGYVTLWIRERLNNPGLETVQGLLVPFAAYILAEQLHASGVLAVVIAGFVVGNGSLSSGYQTRLQERYVWNSVDVLLEAFVFAYIGLHLRFVLEDLREAHESMTDVVVASLVVLGVVLVIRPVWVSLMFGRSVLARRIERNPLTWQEHVVVSWTGMRGVVTLAAAAGIPLTTASGEPFPQRALIQAVAFVVAVGTLLLQGSTLPAMIRRLGVSSPDGGDRYAREHLEAERIVHDAAEDVLSRFAASPPEGLDPGVVAEIRETIARHSQDADHMPDPDEHTLRAEVFSALYRDVLVAQRAVLIAERDSGNVGDEAARAMVDRLDLQEAGVTARLQSRF